LEGITEEERRSGGNEEKTDKYTEEEIVESKSIGKKIESGGDERR